MKFRKKPVLVDAVQYTPGLEDGYACYEIGGRFVGYYDKHGAIPRVVQKPAIMTALGYYEISAGEWVITYADGEKCPCKPEIFAQTYEAADEPPHEDEAHESIRDAYVSAIYVDNDEYYSGYANAVMYVLDTLGIKIEGVNANDNAN